MTAKPLKIINKKIKDGQELYHIHFLGQHRQSAKWLTYEDAIQKYPQSQPILKDYDKQLKYRCGRLKSRYMQYRRSREEKPQPEEGIHKDAIPIRKNQPRMYHNSQIFQQAKLQIRQRQNNRTFLASNFFLQINTPIKLESNWVFGDKVSKVKSKVQGKSMYVVTWQDGTASTVKEQQLIDNDPDNFCQFWEQELGIRKKSKVDKVEISNAGGFERKSEGMREQQIMVDDDKQSL